jgi:hypothetical protein
MARLLLLQSVVVIAVAAVAAGCRTPHADRPREPNAKHPVLEVCRDGESRRVVLRPERMKLRDVAAAAGTDAPAVDAGGYPVPTLLRLTRPDGQHFVETWLIEETAVGDILLGPLDRLDVVPAHRTDLARGVDEVAPRPIPPPPTYVGSLDPFLEWYLSLPRTNWTPARQRALRDRYTRAMDEVARAAALANEFKRSLDPLPTRPEDIGLWTNRLTRFLSDRVNNAERPDLVFTANQAYLRSVYGERLRQSGSVTLDVSVATVFGTVRQSEPPAVKSISGIITPVELKDLVATTSGKASADPDDTVVLLKRDVEGLETTFLLRQKHVSTKESRSAFYLNVLAFDGDEITVIQPEDVPVVRASQLVEEHVVRPALACRSKDENSPLMRHKPGMKATPNRIGPFRSFWPGR